jgi:hypothetical protein
MMDIGLIKNHRKSSIELMPVKSGTYRPRKIKRPEMRGRSLKGTIANE